MAIEQLLFFLLILAIPLLERLIRTMRARTDGSPGDHLPAPDRGTVSRPLSPVPVPEAGTTAPERHGAELPLPVPPLPPALPQAIPQAPREPLLGSERQRRARPERNRSEPSLRPRPSDRPAAVRRVIAGGDLRRAIILITILGPCRALDPKEASPLG